MFEPEEKDVICTFSHGDQNTFVFDISHVKFEISSDIACERVFSKLVGCEGC